MGTLLLKGKPVSDSIRLALEPRVQSLKKIGIVPKLAAIIVGYDPASQVYVRNKARAFEKLNCKSQTYGLDSDSSEEDVLILIETLNDDPTVHGILVQLPLPNHLDAKTILHSVSPKKDVDGLHSYNIGNFFQPSFKERFKQKDYFNILQDKIIIDKYNTKQITNMKETGIGNQRQFRLFIAREILNNFELNNYTPGVFHQAKS